MHEAMTPELRAALGPRREALARSVRAVTRQVEGLEEYARRVQDAPPGPPTLPGPPPVRDVESGRATLPEWPPRAQEGPPFRS
ncbi:hypothetical protein C1I98_20660 [Spongiactinospora gelatinilytica]|uniref:Uncharacterized protein n=2 Tax=Spongiactinospora gelatinilytica TaxID=2666298 RepID=A0A2W2GXE2_9ACTN|nr:hypothetical protein C1I98_20660 [Spongiactinospora gelatinilytica]